MTFYLFSFNNYYNRIVKKFNTIEEYGSPLEIIQNINFNPNDGLNTEQVINYEGSTIPDYVIAVDNNVINSRWFVMDSQRTRALQFKLFLYRDVIADWKDEIVNAPCFIEKAMLSTDNYLIFNKENMSYNQIKKSETLLKDKSGCAWIVGYVDKTFSGRISVLTPNTSVDYDLTSLGDYPYNIYSSSDFKVPETTVFRFNWYDGAGNFPSYTSYCYAWNTSGAAISPLFPSSTTGQYYSNYIYKKSSGTKSVGWKMLINEEYYSTVVTSVVKPFLEDPTINWGSYSPSSYITDLKTSSQLSQLQAENGKLIKVGENCYRIEVYEVTSSSTIGTVPQSSTLGLKMAELATELKKDYNITRSEQPTEPVYELEVSHRNYRISYVPVSLAQFTADIPTDRLHSQHLPYDVFCIPYGDIGIGYSNTPTTKDYAMQFANEIIRAAGSNLYDIQLLPYCPVLDRIIGSSTTGDLRIIGNSDNGDFYLRPATGDAVSVAVWVNNPDFEITINHSINFPNTAMEIKVMNECDIYRLVSPNYNGQFEFSAAKNRGVSEFRIDCSYKPFTPYIKISPLFSGLYGQDFDDARGLICGGDFSLTQTSDPWIQYQINNKNYQVMFDREIKSMDVLNNIQREHEMWNVVSGALTAGSTTGMSAGLGFGAGAGAVAGIVGGGISAFAGMQDIKLSEKMRTEARDFRFDQFGYQLGNIQAMPLNLTKVSAINKNNKIFPFIEMYTCTEIEKDALREKIKYNGMTVMAIGKMQDYIDPNNKNYIKGKLIRIENFNDDFHILNAIANEINQGVFI